MCQEVHNPGAIRTRQGGGWENGWDYLRARDAQLSDIAAVSTVIKEGSLDGRSRPTALEMLNSFISRWDELSS